MNTQRVLTRNVLADTGYSSGVNYAFFEELGLLSYIPQHGQYKGGPDGFNYHKEGNYWECPEGKQVKHRKTFIDKGVKKNQYATKRWDCRDSPIKSQCLGKGHEKRIGITYYKEEYDRGIARLKTKQGKRFKFIRSSAVEPIFGSLTQFFGMRKGNTIRIKQASKAMLMAGAAYNLKKYMKFTGKKVMSKVETVKASTLLFLGQLFLLKKRLVPVKL